MSRRWRNSIRHEYNGGRSWDDSAEWCRRCSQGKSSWQHSPREPWWTFGLRWRR